MNYPDFQHVQIPPLASSPLLDLEIQIHPPRFIALGPSQRKLVAVHFSGGNFRGDGIEGVVLPGGADHAVLESEDFLRIEVRAMLQTNDDALIDLRYTGLWRAEPGKLARALAPDGAGHFRPSEHYLRVTASFLTDSARYARLNGVIAIGIGCRTAKGVAYRFHELL